MMYDFDKVIIRRHSGCYKWDDCEDEDVIPMWIADMDFQVAQPIIDALRKRVEHGVFGYTKVQDSFYQSIINWFSRRHQWTIERDWILYTTGVVPAISSALKALTLPGERVLMLTPIYNCFYSCILNNGCVAQECQLVRKDDTYIIDFDEFERQAANEKTTVFLLCNPHNPGGRVWTREELARLNEICMRHGVKVISDEIHCELVMPGYTYTPFAAVNEDCLNNSVINTSPSKSFNIAGLQTSTVICKDPILRRHIDRAINISETCDLNPFGPLALEAAYNEGEQWIDELNEYIWGNYQALKQFFAEELPCIHVTKLEGSYLAWIDISAVELTSDEAAAKLVKEGKVRVCSGTIYGKKAGQGYLRINLACPRSILMEGLKRIGRVLSAYLPDDSEQGCPM